VLSARYSTIVYLYILLVAIPPPWAWPGGCGHQIISIP